MEHPSRRDRRRHRALSSTRAQLLAAVLATVVGAVLLVPVAARAGSGSAEQAVVARAAAAEVSVRGIAPGSTSSSDGTVVSPDGEGLVVDPLRPGGSYSADLPGGEALDLTVTHAVTLDEAGRGAGGLYDRTEVRRGSGGDHYALTLVVRPRGHVVALLVRQVDGRRTVLARSGKLAVASPGRPVNAELRVTGSSAVELAARVWQDDEAVPDWQLTATDRDDLRITTAGTAAVGGYLSRSVAEQSVTVSSAAWQDLSPGAGASAPVTPVAPSDGPTTTDDPSATDEPSAPDEPSATDEPTSPQAPMPTASSDGGDPTSEPGGAAPSGAPAPAGEPTSTSPVTIPSVQPSTSAAGFQHPGIMTSASQLDAVRRQAARGAEPWASALARTRASKYASLSWTPHPVAWVGCGSYNAPNEGCTDETDDAQAAYTHALLWTLTGDRRHADKAAEILDAWASTLQGHRFDTAVYKNGRLQAAWAGQVFPKAAELLRYSDSGWGEARAQRFGEVLRSAFLPMVRDGWIGGGSNWQMSMADATIAIGVYLDDRSVFDDGVGDWRRQLPATIYLSSDGPLPVVPPGTVIARSGLTSYWKQATSYVDGLQQETCRDADHMTMGIAAAVGAAETASIQGVDLYAEGRDRLVAAMEYNTRYLSDPGAAGWACPQPLKTIGTASRLGWEVGYHHYAVVDGIPMPATRRWIETVRPKNRSELFMNWTTLTHGS